MDISGCNHLLYQQEVLKFSKKKNFKSFREAVCNVMICCIDSQLTKDNL